jgi:hypothetical protein
MVRRVGVGHRPGGTGRVVGPLLTGRLQEVVGKEGGPRRATRDPLLLLRCTLDSYFITLQL